MPRQGGKQGEKLGRLGFDPQHQTPEKRGKLWDETRLGTGPSTSSEHGHPSLQSLGKPLLSLEPTFLVRNLRILGFPH